jgi:hypothetical protein
MHRATLTEVGHNVAEPWVRESLSQGFEFSHKVAETIDFSTGRFYVIAPLATEQISPWGLGGPMSQISADTVLMETLESARDRGMKCVLVEDDMGQRSDPAQPDSHHYQSSHLGERLTHWVDLTTAEILDALCCIKHGPSGYPLNSFGTARSTRDLDLVAGGELTITTVSRVAESAQMVLTSAFDGESFALWLDYGLSMPRAPRTDRRFHLDEYEAFEAMRLFIDQFAARAGDDMVTLIGDISSLDDRTDHTWDPAAWDNWMACVEQVKRTQGREHR